MISTTINNQEIQVHFNVNDSFDYHCSIDHYAIKMDLSEKSYEDYESIKSHLVFLWGDQATCIHGLREQELIIVFNVPKDDYIILKIHELEGALTSIVDDIKESFKESEGLDVPFVIDIGISNVR